MGEERLHGEAVSDSVIDAWAAEAEEAYSVERLRERGATEVESRDGVAPAASHATGRPPAAE